MPLPMMFDQVQNRIAANTGRYRSPNLWGGGPNPCPWESIVNGEVSGVAMYDDFVEFPYITTPTITTQAAIGGKLGYKAFGSSGGTLVSSGARYGEIVFTETDDNEGVGLATIALPFQLSRTYGDLWFEARLKIGTITDNDSGFFLGFAGAQTLSATVPITAAGALADINLCGFHRLEGDGDQIDTVYKADGVTAVSLQTDVITSTNASSGSALVADTYIKLGMRLESDTGTLRFFVNNLELGTTKTVPTNTGSDFPADVPMGLCLAMLCGSNNDSVLTMDWWRAAQLGTV